MVAGCQLSKTLLLMSLVCTVIDRFEHVLNCNDMCTGYVCIKEAYLHIFSFSPPVKSDTEIKCHISYCQPPVLYHFRF
jgi:hypothetical protein